MSQRREFDFDELTPGTKNSYRMTVTVREACDLVDMDAMTSGDRSSRESVQSERRRRSWLFFGRRKRPLTM